MANVLKRRDFLEIHLDTAEAPPRTSSGMLHPASSESTIKPPPLTEGSASAQEQVTRGEQECEEAVDWETIAGYLSRCQSSPPPHSSLDFEPILLPQHRATAHNLHRDLLLLRRNSNGIPPSMSKTPSNPPPQPTPPPSPTPMSSTGLSTGAKAGIAGVAAVGVVILLASLVAFHTHRRRKKYSSRFRASASGRTSKTSHMDSEGNFTSPEDRGEDMPMMYKSRTAITGLGIEGGGPLSPEFVGGNTPLMNDEYNISRHSNLDYQASPTMESHRMYNSPSSLGLYRPPSQQTSYIPTPIENTQAAQDPFEQHNQRSRPSHPLSGLSEAIPSPPLQKRMPHSMADYQSAVPLGFANGFVQVEREEDGDIGTHAETRFEIDMDGMSDSDIENEREVEIAIEGDEGPDGDESLPVYEETPGKPGGLGVGEKEFRRREEGDDGDDSEEERSFETHLTKSDLG